VALDSDIITLARDTMKSDPIDPSIKELIKQYSGKVGAWGQSDILVELTDEELGDELIKVMKSKGWHLDEEGSDSRNLFFHLGNDSKSEEKPYDSTYELSQDDQDMWSACISQKLLFVVLVIFLGFMTYTVFTDPRVSNFRYPLAYQIVIVVVTIRVLYYKFSAISWSLEIDGNNIIVRRFFRSEVIPAQKIKRVINEESRYWSRDITIILHHQGEIMCQGLNKQEATRLASRLKSLKSAAMPLRTTA